MLMYIVVVLCCTPHVANITDSCTITSCCSSVHASFILPFPSYIYSSDPHALQYDTLTAHPFLCPVGPFLTQTDAAFLASLWHQKIRSASKMAVSSSYLSIESVSSGRISSSGGKIGICLANYLSPLDWLLPLLTVILVPLLTQDSFPGTSSVLISTPLGTASAVPRRFERLRASEVRLTFLSWGALLFPRTPCFIVPTLLYRIQLL